MKVLPEKSELETNYFKPICQFGDHALVRRLLGVTMTFTDLTIPTIYDCVIPDASKYTILSDQRTIGPTGLGTNGSFDEKTFFWTNGPFDK